MSRITRYVFRDLFWPTMVGLLIYGVVLVMNLLLEAAELYIRRDLPLGLVGRYLLLALPRILVLVIPMAVLLGVLVGFGRLLADSEIKALRACGYSDRRLLAPVLILGVGGALASAALYNFAVPAANYEQHRLNAQIFLRGDINREIQPGVFYERIPNLLIYADDASAADGTLSDVLIYQKGPTGLEEFSTARRVWMQQQERRGAIEFHLDDVVSHAWSNSIPDHYQLSRSSSQVIDRPPDLLVQEMIRSLSSPPPRNLREQSFAELRATLTVLRREADTPSRKRQIDQTLVELHKKIAIPSASIVFACLGLPLALGHRRPAGRTWGFIVSLLVIAISYFLLTAGEQMADRGRIDPWIGIWSGNLLFGFIALLLIVTGSRVDVSAWFPGRRRRRQETAQTTIGQIIAATREAELDIPAPRLRQRRFPSTIERYMFRHVIPASGLVALSLLVLFSIFYAVDLVDDLSKGTRPVSLLFPYLLYIQPQVLFAYVAPMSLCIGTLVSFAMLARTHELTAIRAGGIGLFRVIVPFLIVAAIVSCVSFVAHERLLPSTNQRANQIRDEIRNRSPRSYRRPERRWVFGSQGLLFNFSDFNVSRKEFQELGVIRFQEGTFQIAEHTFASRAYREGDAWNLRDGWVRRFTDQGEVYERFAAMRNTEIDPPEYFVQDWKAPDQMNFVELRRYVEDLDRRGHDTRELRVGLHRKIAVPVVSFVMVLIALPFAVRVERRGAMFSIAVSVMIVFVYFGVLQTFGKLGEVAVLPPVVASWAPNAIFSLLGIYLTGMSRW